MKKTKNKGRVFTNDKLRKARKVAWVWVEQAPCGGLLHTPEGIMSYNKGDYILHDQEQTHRWPVKKDIFESTYTYIGD